MALAMSINKRSQEIAEHVQWDGKLHVSSEDIIYVLKNIQVESNSSMISLYDDPVKNHSSRFFCLSPEKTLMMIDTMSTEDVFGHLRKIMPSFFASKHETRRLKKAINGKMRILNPKKTATGMSIDPLRLLKAMPFIFISLVGYRRMVEAVW